MHHHAKAEQPLFVIIEPQQATQGGQVLRKPVRVTHHGLRLIERLSGSLQLAESQRSIEFICVN